MERLRKLLKMQKKKEVGGSEGKHRKPETPDQSVEPTQLSFIDAVKHGKCPKFLSQLIHSGADWKVRGPLVDTAENFHWNPDIDNPEDWKKFGEIYGFTLLHYAAMYGNLEALKFLLELEGMAPDLPDFHGRTSLQIALYLAKRNVREILETLVEHGADVNAVGKYRPVLDYAVKGLRDVDILSRLVDLGVDWNKWEASWSVLHTTASSGHLDALKFFLSLDKFSARDEVTKTDYRGTPLHCVVRDAKQNAWEMVDLLVQKGADVNAATLSGESVFLYAVQGNRDGEFLSKLVGFGADWKKRDSHGLTAIHHAAHSGSEDSLRYLVKLGGIEIDARDDQGRTPLHYAVDPLPMFVEGQKSMDKVATLLINKGADVNAVDEYGNSVFHHAAKNMTGNGNLLSFLIKRGSDPMTLDNKNCSALHIAARTGTVNSLKFLLKMGKLDVNLGNDEGATPLHEAVDGTIDDGLVIKLRLLLELGADKGMLNYEDKSPYDVLVERRDHPHYFQEPEPPQEAYELLEFL